MKKQVIYKTDKMIGITSVENWNRLVYEKEIVVKEMLLCLCSPQFIEWVNDCDPQELGQCLLIELKQDKQTIHSN